jgi:tRNA A37 methylthiotransferase MiaB
MNRKYTIADFKKIIASFKSFIPQITIWTDVIVGYPGETEQDFRSTVDLIKEIKPDFVNISKFGPRPGTQAAKLPDTQSKIKNERSKMLSNIIAKISLEKNKVWLGWKGDIIIDEWNQSKRNWIGHNYAYKPVAINGRFRFGQFVNVKIISVTKTHLVGMPI